MYSVFYPTIARRVVENTIELTANGDEMHTLTIHPRHPGIIFEKIVVDYGGYQSQYLFGKETDVKKQ
jgi:hypothetical protein